LLVATSLRCCETWKSRNSPNYDGTLTDIIPAVDERSRAPESLAFWLAPLVSTLPLIPFFSFPFSPLFLGKLGDDPTHPFFWPGLGPWLAAMAVVFDGTLLAYFVAIPLFVLLKMTGRISATRLLVIFSVTGILASQLVHGFENFREPALHQFAASWLSPLFGCLCGLTSGAYFLFVPHRRLSAAARVICYSLPVAILAACGSALVWSAKLWHISR